MTQHELEKMQLIQLDMMDDIHRICDTSNISYYIIGGTALGAVRHKGYIPWDVDIDIAMPREDYEKFKIVFQNELGEKYQYNDYLSIKDYMRPHAIVCDKNSIIYLKHDEFNPVNAKHGIYIDIFPLDNAPDDIYLRKKQSYILKKIRKLKSYRIPYSYSYKKWKRTAHYIVSAILSPISVYKINEFQQKVMQKYRNIQTKCLCSMASQYPYEKQCMSRDIYGTPTLVDFEGRKYFAPEKCHEYLTRIYGDYMQLPPIEKRQANMEIFAKIDFL